MPFVGLLAVELIQRFRLKAVVGLTIAAVATMAASVAWIEINPIASSPFNVDQVIAFLNSDDHAKFRYITLGFGSHFAQVSTYAKADSVDGDYNSARLLPEMTAYGAGQLYNAKYYGLAGMESLRAVLKHANQYGLKYVFVRDRYYEPLLAFAGWRKAETYDNGNVTLWTKEDVPPAKQLEFVGFMPTETEGIMWGILPVASSLFALFLVLLVPEERRVGRTLEVPIAGNRRADGIAGGQVMKRILPIAIIVLTVVLIAMATIQPNEASAAKSPDGAVRSLFANVQGHNYKGAFSYVANASDMDEQAFAHDLAGRDGSLRTYSSLQTGGYQSPTCHRRSGVGARHARVLHRGGCVLRHARSEGGEGRRSLEGGMAGGDRSQSPATGNPGKLSALGCDHSRCQR